MPLPRIYFEKLLESSPDIVVAVDRQGLIIFYNDGARQTLGYSYEEVLGKTVETVYPSRDEAKRVMRAMRTGEHAERGKVKNFPTVFTTKSGEHVPVAISGSVIYDDAGNEIGSIGFAKDLHLIRRHEQLATLGEIAVSLAHEINNPLEVILNTMQLVEDCVRRLATDEQMVIEAEHFETLGRELDKIQQIVNRVQELAKGAEYETRQYLPGTLMTALSAGNQRSAHASEAEGASGDTAVPHTGNDQAARTSLAGLDILVVDDDLGVCQSLAELLRLQGSKVAIATAARQALHLLEGRGFDLVLSDVVMPDMDGYDLYIELKERRPRLPVILMTGYLYDRDHVIKRSKLAGLDTGVLFKKPIDPERLKTIILSHCTTQESSLRQCSNSSRNSSPS